MASGEDAELAPDGCLAQAIEGAVLGDGSVPCWQSILFLIWAIAGVAVSRFQKHMSPTLVRLFAALQGAKPVASAEHDVEHGFTFLEEQQCRY